MTRLADRFGASLNPNELLPALVAAVDSGSTVDSDIFNWGASNTRRLVSSLAAAKAGTGYSDHLVIGDGQSYNPLSSLADLWPNVLRRHLAADGLTDGGTGWVRPQNGYLSDLDSRVTKSGTWTLVGDGGVYWRSSSSGATMTFVSDVAGTAVSVAYYNTSAAFTVSIDGGAPVTVTPSGASTVGTYSVTGLSDTTHTVVVTTSSSSYVFIVGFQCYRPNSIRVHNLAGYGWKTSQVNSSTAFTSGWTIQQMIPDPDVVHIAIGFHDIYESVSIPTITANIATIRNLWPDADVILHAGPQGTGMTNWPAYVTALYSLASSLNVPLVDFYRRSGSGYDAAADAGLMLPPSNDYYPSATGHAAWALLASSRMKLEDATASAATVKAGGALGTPSSGTLTNCTGLPQSGVTGLGTKNAANGFAGLDSNGLVISSLMTKRRRDYLTSGEATMRRMDINATPSLGQGALRLTYFTAEKTETITKVQTTCSGAVNTPTLQRIGVYSVAANGDLTLVAATADDHAALWLSTGEFETSFSASWTKTEGVEYAVGLLSVATTGPSLYGYGGAGATILGKAPRLSGFVSSVSDLGAISSTISAGSISSTGNMYYAALVP